MPAHRIKSKVYSQSEEGLNQGYLSPNWSRQHGLSPRGWGQQNQQRRVV